MTVNSVNSRRPGWSGAMPLSFSLTGNWPVRQLRSSLEILSYQNTPIIRRRSVLRKVGSFWLTVVVALIALQRFCFVTYVFEFFLFIITSVMGHGLPYIPNLKLNIRSSHRNIIHCHRPGAVPTPSKNSGKILTFVGLSKD